MRGPAFALFALSIPYFIEGRLQSLSNAAQRVITGSSSFDEAMLSILRGKEAEEIFLSVPDEQVALEYVD